MGILERLMGNREPKPPLTENIGAATARRFAAFVEEAGRLPRDTPLAAYEAVTPLLDATPREQIETVFACFDFLYEFVETRGAGSAPAKAWSERTGVTALATRLMKRRLPYTDDDLTTLVDTSRLHFHWLPSKSVVRALELRPEQRPLIERLRQAIDKLLEELLEVSTTADVRTIAKRLAQVLNGPIDAPFTLEPVDAWTVALRGALDNLGSDEREMWAALLEHCSRASSARPTAKWKRQADAASRRVPVETFYKMLETAVDALGTPAPFPVQIADSWQGGTVDGDPRLVAEGYADCLRGLIWCAGGLKAPSRVAILGDAAERCFKKLPGHGPLSPKVGNACLNVLADLACRDAIGQLTRLASRAKHASSRARVAKALERAAETAGLAPDDLEDLAVPTCGLTEVGLCRRTVGNYQAELRVSGTRSTTLTWVKHDGKVQKSVPKAVKERQPDALKALKRSAKEIQQMLPAQRNRLEGQLLRRRTLPLDVWRERYLDHPLVGCVARRLIWCFGEGDDQKLAAWREDRLVQIGGTTFEASADTPVRLWHPIESSAETVRAWRDWLLANGVTQPFKQAHREIYILTDAERESESYSNRFAAHILKQHQFNALANQRGWHYELQGCWDSHNTPTLELADLGWRAEFWVEFAGDPGTDVSEMAVFLYVATDQVRFYRSDAHEPSQLADVPPLIFSEAMRDVDLFVGVSSVANDPAWCDTGAREPQGANHVDYWARWSFGELTETAKTRKEILAALLPKLKIADRCRLAGRHLVVRGDRRTYNIHLGSGNIQMEPDNHYLCIVPGRRAGDPPQNVLLPFEGDRTLSVILSKAILLANDRKITDPTINNQIESR